MNRPVDSVVETQRLNGFSRSLFTAGSPRSFSGVSLQAARNASANRGIRGLDIDRKLPEPDEGGQIILLDDLERFFNNPSGSFFRQRLDRSEEHTSELQSRGHLVCRLLLEKKKRL